MPLMIWSQRYSLQVKEIDDQHKKLFAIANNLHEAVSQAQSRELIGEILDELVDYTNYHFSTEEAYMDRYHYPDPEAAEHRNEHRELVEKVIAIQRRFHSDEADVTLDLLIFLVEWLQHHIGVIDKKLGRFLNSKGLRSSGMNAKDGST